MSIICPFCRSSIPDDATVCRHCGAEKRYVKVPPRSLLLRIIYGIGFAIGIFVIGHVLRAIFTFPEYLITLAMVGGFILVCLDDASTEARWFR